MPNLNELIDEFAKKLFGITKKEAHWKEICIKCKRSVEEFKREMDVLDKEEYKISALCPKCYAESCETLRERGDND